MVTSHINCSENIFFKSISVSNVLASSQCQSKFGLQSALKHDAMMVSTSSAVQKGHYIHFKFYKVSKRAIILTFVQVFASYDIFYVVRFLFYFEPNLKALF